MHSRWFAGLTHIVRLARWVHVIDFHPCRLCKGPVARRSHDDNDGCGADHHGARRDSAPRARAAQADRPWGQCQGMRTGVRSTSSVQAALVGWPLRCGSTHQQPRFGCGEAATAAPSFASLTSSTGTPSTATSTLHALVADPCSSFAVVASAVGLPSLKVGTFVAGNTTAGGVDGGSTPCWSATSVLAMTAAPVRGVCRDGE